NVRLDLEEFTQAFIAAVGGEIDRAAADDVRRFLQLFLQDKWKEWAEREGEKVSALLERLAEEIIQVTNENLSDAMATLARELGLRGISWGFGAALTGLVPAAGDAPHRGIWEVRDRALAEGKAQGAAAAQGAAELAAQVDDLAAIERRLEALREQLWSPP